MSLLLLGALSKEALAQSGQQPQLVKKLPAISCQTPDRNSAVYQMQAQYNHKRYILAEQLGREILSSEPTNLRVHYLLGNIYSALNEPEKARRQYNYCLAVGGQKQEAHLAEAGLRALDSKSPPPAKTIAAHPVDAKLLARSLHILQKAQDIIVAKHNEALTMIAHSGEFARSRAREIPDNLTQKPATLPAGSGAASNSESTGTVNYGRPGEIRALKAEQARAVKRIAEAYERKEKSIVDETMSEVDKLIGPDQISETKRPAPNITDAKIPTLSAADVFAVSGITLGEKSRILQVATGSDAHRAGLIAGDVIAQKYFGADQKDFSIIILRGGKTYRIVLHPLKSKLAIADKTAQIARFKNVPVDNRKTIREKTWARIRNSEVIFLVDMSYNMTIPIGETGMGRWEWAAHRIADLAEKISDKDNLTFSVSECTKVEFRRRDQSPQSILRFLLGSTPRGAANMSSPLASAISDYFDSKRPVLIMIFTTGRFELGESLEPIIYNAAGQLRDPENLRIVFVQIGDDPEGGALMQMLDDDLTFTGTKYDIVDYITFSELQASGLSSALLDVYEKPRSHGAAAELPITNILTERIARIQAQLAH